MCMPLSRVSRVHIIVDHDVVIGSHSGYLLRNGSIYFYCYIKHVLLLH